MSSGNSSILCTQNNSDYQLVRMCASQFPQNIQHTLCWDFFHLLREHSLFMVGGGGGELEGGGGENFATYCRVGGGGQLFFSILFWRGDFFLTHYFANFFLRK